MLRHAIEIAAAILCHFRRDFAFFAMLVSLTRFRIAAAATRYYISRHFFFRQLFAAAARLRCRCFCRDACFALPPLTVSCHDIFADMPCLLLITPYFAAILADAYIFFDCRHLRLLLRAFIPRPLPASLRHYADDAEMLMLCRRHCHLMRDAYA